MGGYSVESTKTEKGKRIKGRRDWILVLIFMAGLGFRLFGIHWGMPNYFHPDERQVMFQVTDIKLNKVETYNPKFFAYGSLPIYFLKITVVSLDTANKFVRETLKGSHFSPEVERTVRNLFPSVTNFKGMIMTGRVVSALLSALTILMVYKIGFLIYDRKTALLAATFFAFSVLSIQQAHFYIVDGPQTFLVTCAMLFLMRVAIGQRNRDYYYAGIFIGMAMATKFSTAPIALAYVIAHILAVVDGRRTSRSAWVHWVAGGILAVVVMTACMPFWILDFTEFWHDVTEQKRMVTGAVSLPYTIQYENTSSFFYLIKNMILWSMGLPLGLAVYIGFGFAIWRVFKRSSDRANIVLLAWVIPLFILNSTFKVKFLRYTLVLFPFFSIFAAYWLRSLPRTIGRFKARAITAFVVLGAILWSIAFASIYTEPNTRHQASDWVYENIPEGSKIILESNWDDALPVSTKAGNPRKYTIEKLSIYKEPDNWRKAERMADIIESGDVIILASKRHYGSVLRVPHRYPVSGSFYRCLFAERLGFKHVKTFTVPPHIGPIQFHDDLADESFRVYEHARADIFVKETPLSREQIKDLLIAPPPEVANISYEEILTSRPKSEIGSPVKFPIIRWILALEILGFIFIPAVFLIFNRFDHRGYPMTKIIGLLVAGYLCWILPSFKIFPFSFTLIVLVLMIFAFLNYMIYQKHRDEIRRFFRERWWSILGYELLFFATFAMFALLKSYNPDIYWSESSMDFGFLNAVMRTQFFPPLDPWIQGEFINYYYYGHYFAAFLTKLSGVTANYGYNLFFVTIPSLVALSVGSLLISLTRRVWAGISAVVFSIVIGNLDGIAQMAQIWKSLARKTETAQLAGYFNDFVGLFLNLGRSARHFRFFRSAHELINPTVHEFPYWSYNFMDLHAHTIATMISTMLLAMHLVIYRNGKKGMNMFGDGLTRILTVLVMIIAFGALIPTNSWDFPTQVLILIFISIWFVNESRLRKKRVYEVNLMDPVHEVFPSEQITSPPETPSVEVVEGDLSSETDSADLSDNEISEEMPIGEIDSEMPGDEDESPDDEDDEREDPEDLALDDEPEIEPETEPDYDSQDDLDVVTEEDPVDSVPDSDGIESHDVQIEDNSYKLSDEKSETAVMKKTTVINIEEMPFPEESLDESDNEQSPEGSVTNPEETDDEDPPQFSRMSAYLEDSKTLDDNGDDEGDSDGHGDGDGDGEDNGDGTGDEDEHLSENIPLQADDIANSDMNYDEPESETPEPVEDTPEPVEDAFEPEEEMSEPLDEAFQPEEELPIEVPEFSDEVPETILSNGDDLVDTVPSPEDADESEDFSTASSVELTDAVDIFLDPSISDSEPESLDPTSESEMGMPLEGIAPAAVKAPRRSIFKIGANFVKFLYREVIDSVVFLWQVLLPVFVIVAGAILFYMPYLRHFSRKGMGIGFLWKYRQSTNMDGFITMFGFFLFIFATLFVKWWFSNCRRRGLSMVRIIITALIFLSVAAGTYTGFKLIPDPGMDYGVLILSVSLMIIILNIWFTGKPDRNQMFVLLLGFMAVSITAGCELIFIKDFYQGGGHRRFNTIFKFYLQAWFMFAIVSAFLIASRSRIRYTGPSSRIKRLSAGFGGLIWNIVFVLLLAGSLIFTIEGPRARRHHDEYRRVDLPLTLDGWAYMKQGPLKDEYRAIEWLQANVKGTPVILEATGADYLYKYARISANTGLPTVVGWWSHVDQREYKKKAGNLKRDVLEIYDGMDVPKMLELLRKYQVKFIYVGSTERSEYSDSGIEKFAELTDYMTPVYANQSVTIYQVNDYGLNVDFAKVAADSDALAALQERLITANAEKAVAKEKAEQIRRDSVRKQKPRTMFQGGEGEARGMLKEPRSLAVDTDGSVYVADFRNHRVQKFNADGTWAMQWGVSGEGPGQFNDICDLAVDDQGIYVADTFHNRVQKFSKDGKYMGAWKDGQGSFYYPRGITTDGKGHVYLVDSGHHRIVKFTNTGKFVKAWGKLGDKPGQMENPIGIAYDDEKLYVVDTKNYRIQVFSTDGQLMNGFAVDGWEGEVFVEPYVVLDNQKRIWVSDPTARKILVYSNDGKLLKTVDRVKGQGFKVPMGLARDLSGDILLVDAHGHKVIKIPLTIVDAQK